MRGAGDIFKKKATLEERQEALTALRNAIADTHRYYYDTKALSGKQKQRLRGRRKELSDSWRNTSELFQRIGLRRIKALTYLKQLGWANPDLWDTPEFASEPLGLDTMREFGDWLDQEIHSLRQK